ncbi:MAG: hypothetical protein KME59_21365 [Trichormus sp. ATA11-4-KO1]|jgi:hypothetical protein|nr:hypothetical protein [Trichormus sp. ATA11-4-KO1]
MTNDKREQEKQQVREQWVKDEAELQIYKEQIKLSKEAAEKDSRGSGR